MKFCLDCGSPVIAVGDKFVRFRCITCGKVHYKNPKVGVAVILDINSQILFVRRKEEPFRGWWSLPAGYVEYEESCEDTAQREAYEETGVNISLTGIVGVYSYTDDPRSNMVLVVYRAKCVSQSFHAGDDAEEVRLFSTSGLPEQIAFSGIRDAIKDYLLPPINGVPAFGNLGRNK